MKMIDFSGYLEQLERTASRNLMTEILAQMLKEIEGEEVKQAVYLSLGQLRPKFDRLETNMAEKLVVRGLAETFGVETKRVWNQYKQVGDLGTVAEKLKTPHFVPRSGTSRGRQNSKLNNEKLSITQVYGALVAIAQEGGAGSQERKLTKFTELIKQLDPLSVRYVTRMVVGKLRLGFSEMTLLDALAVMDSGSKKAREILERSYQVYPDVGELAMEVKRVGITAVDERVNVTLGVPVVPALCQRLKTADEMIKKMGMIVMEPKFDGTRVQIHFRKRSIVDSGQSFGNAQDEASDKRQEWNIRTFSRTLDETTWMFPELTQATSQIEADEAILDSEAVGVDPKTGRTLPFQETITRKRKYDIVAVAGRVPLKFMVFDVLYKDGESLIHKPLYERKKVLERTVRGNGPLVVVEAQETDEAQTLREFHTKQLAAGNEGAVIKQVGSVYEPGRRGWSWVKFKEAETSQAKLPDTVDVVVMGFYRGRGKRTKFGIGAFLVGIMDTEGQIMTIAKIGTGLTDEQWQELKRRLDEVVAMEEPNRYVVDKMLVPDVWVDPAVVVEIAADEVTKSPTHSAGLALRFPRLVRFRDDKSVAELTTVSELEQMGQLGR